MFAGWRLFFERLAAEKPVVLLVEDAQYADAGLLDFLDHLIDWARDLPIYVLVFARPELDEVRPGFGAGRNRITLTLDPLDPASMGTLVEALVPGMPAPVRAKVTAQAQGIPLFAVETIRALIDRDIVQPSEGVYRLVGDVGELVVPDSLHGLLAARLDALQPEVRRLVTDAAVLGTTFPAEALIAVSERDDASVRATLADLVRREVLSVSADPLSPERGSYQFAQQMLRQVAYDTLSRRDRKARHLAVAAHLRTAFPGDGEEVTDVIARHYLDALNAVPDAPDAAEIRGQAVAVMTRAAERAERTGAPAQAAASYAAAAELSPADEATAGLWERAAQAAIADASYPAAIKYAEQARGQYLQRGQDRAAARVQAIAGRALSDWGRRAEAREHFLAALQVLRAMPDTDTVWVLNRLAVLEVFSGSPDADQLSAEALTLGQALGVGPSQLGELFLCRGLYHVREGRRPQAISYLRESARLAERVGDSFVAGRALLNLSDALGSTEPSAAAEAARTAAGALRRTGARRQLAAAIMNVAEALLQTGDWDTASAELTPDVDSDALADLEDLAVERGWLAALRGDHGTAEAVLRSLRDIRANEDPQTIAGIGVLKAFAAAARRQPVDALRHARAILASVEAIGISNIFPRWAWPLAVRCAHELADTTAVRDLLAFLDAYQCGYLAPMLQAERDLVRARLAAADGDATAAASFTAAIKSLRELSTPYHLAHGLLDHAEYLMAAGSAAVAASAIAEARDIAGRLRCQPLLDRAYALTQRDPVTATPQDAPRALR
jgi:tetratricopeptide (TPR) repeat protein